MTKERRLGRGLAALLGSPADAPPAPPTLKVHQPEDTPQQPRRAPSAPTTDAPATQPPAGIVQLDVYSIDDNPFQPRRVFREAEIASLAESLKSHDMLQPIVVRPVGDRFQLISGERRLRAAIKAGWQQVPAQVREADDRLVAELAIVENLQRKDLNPIEKALSFQRYLQQHACKQEDLAQRLKIDRSTIANLMRLLDLPSDVQELVAGEKLSASHARALLPLGEAILQCEVARQCLEQGLSVRATEARVQEILREAGVDLEPKKQTRRGRHLAHLEEEIRKNLGGLKVRIKDSGNGRGKVTIEFATHDQFDRLYAYLTDAQPDEVKLLTVLGADASKG